MNKISLVVLLAAWTMAAVECAEFFTHQDLLDWEPPAELKKMYPYYLAGVDKEGSPVWVIEYGKWDIRSTMEKEGQIVKDFEKYTEQMFYRWHYSPLNFTTKNNLGNKYVLIADLKGFNNRQFLHVPTVQRYFSIVSQFVESQREYPNLKKEYIINSNVLFNTLFTLSRPLLTPLMQYIDLYNEDSKKWKKALQSHIDMDQLPEWYGGHPTGGYQNKWKPLKVYG